MELDEKIARGRKPVSEDITSVFRLSQEAKRQFEEILEKIPKNHITTETSTSRVIDGLPPQISDAEKNWLKTHHQTNKLFGRICYLIKNQNRP